VTAPRNNPSAGVDPAYAWTVGDHWPFDRDGDDLDAEQTRSRISGGAEA
jgi:hypothetical protein